MSVTLTPVIILCMSCKLHRCSRAAHELHDGTSISCQADWNSSFPLAHLSSSNSFWIVSLPGWSVTVTILIVYLYISVACTLGTSKAPELQTSNNHCFLLLDYFAVCYPNSIRLHLLVLTVKVCHSSASPFSCCVGLAFCDSSVLANQLIFHLHFTLCLHFDILHPQKAFFACSVKVFSSFRLFFKSYY